MPTYGNYDFLSQESDINLYYSLLHDTEINATAKYDLPHFGTQNRHHFKPFRHFQEKKDKLKDLLLCNLLE